MVSFLHQTPKSVDSGDILGRIKTLNAVAQRDKTGMSQLIDLQKSVIAPERGLFCLSSCDANHCLEMENQAQIQLLPRLKFMNRVDPLTLHFDSLIVVVSNLKAAEFPGKDVVLKQKKVIH